MPRCASATAVQRTLIRRWNGRTWSTVPSPNPGADWDYLYSVSAISAAGAWAVGYDSLPVGSGTEISGTLILHWNGHAWSRVSSPNPSRDLNQLDGVSVVSAKNAWAVGYDQTAAGGYEPLILHWNGKTWSRARSPRVSAFSAALSAVSRGRGFRLGLLRLRRQLGIRDARRGAGAGRSGGRGEPARSACGTIGGCARGS